MSYALYLRCKSETAARNDVMTGGMAVKSFIDEIAAAKARLQELDLEIAEFSADAVARAEHAAGIRREIDNISEDIASDRSSVAEMQERIIQGERSLDERTAELQRMIDDGADERLVDMKRERDDLASRIAELQYSVDADDMARSATPW